jgi:hypothetical protein
VKRKEWNPEQQQIKPYRNGEGMEPRATTNKTIQK